METGPSFASLLTRKSPAMSYGHGWIVSENGKRWHPARDQSELLAEVSIKKKVKKGCGSPLLMLFTSLFTRMKITRYVRVSWSVVIHLYQVMVATILR